MQENGRNTTLTSVDVKTREINNFVFILRFISAANFM
jgi:hypothetical protein